MIHRLLPALTFGGVLFIALALAGGCSFKKPYPAKHTFLVEARRASEGRPASGSAVLRVRSLPVAAPFDGKGFVYRRSGLGYESDFYNEFLVAPRTLLTEQVRHWLGGSSVFGFVLEPASTVEPTHTLEGNVSALYGDFRDTGSPKAVLVIEFFLIEEKAASRAVRFHQSYRQEISLDNRAPETLARGWSKALEQILTALETDLAKILQK